jgi:hypothetical protein
MIQVQRRRANAMGKNPKSIFLRLLIVVGCSAAAFALLFYLIYYLSEVKNLPEWKKYSVPSEKITKILFIKSYSTGVLVKTAAGDLFLCGYDGCSPSSVTEQQAELQEDIYVCADRGYKVEDNPPPGKVIDSCTFMGPEMGAHVVLLEDNSLWRLDYGPPPFMWSGFVIASGAFLGFVIGLFIWLAWLIVVDIKARRSARKETTGQV